MEQRQERVWEAALRLIPLLKSLGVTQMPWEHIPALCEGPCNHIHVFYGRSLWPHTCPLEGPLKLLSPLLEACLQACVLCGNCKPSRDIQKSPPLPFGVMLHLPGTSARASLGPNSTNTRSSSSAVPSLARPCSKPVICRAH